jgi:hypothetical protein
MLFLFSAFAGTPDEAMVQPETPPPPTGLSFLGLVQARGSITNIATTSAFSDGQVVGLLGGSNLTVVSEEDRAITSEYRTDGFFTYAPPILDGKASLTAAFEVDFGFGDQSYGVGGNTGGGFGADQVNLQTRRLHATFNSSMGAHQLSTVVGLQFVGDGVYNPATARLDDLIRSGGGLRFFGSEAAGVSVYGRYRDDWGDRVRYRLGGYTLYEKGSSLPDDVTLYMADVQAHPLYAFQLGLHGWYLRDRTGGAAGVAGVGPTSLLSQLQGGPYLDLREDGVEEYPAVNADLFWVGIDGGFNHRLDQGPLGVGISSFWNLGDLLAVDAPDASVRGLALAGEARWRYLPGEGSILKIEGVYTSADGTGRDAYTGVLTGNSYGVVGSVWATHGTYLLFQDFKAINRQVAVVYDLSNQGNGLVAGIVSAGLDPIPDQLNLQLTAAHALSARMEPMGTELNLKLSGHPLPFLELGTVGATVLNTSFETAPWTVFTYLDWVVF